MPTVTLLENHLRTKRVLLFHRTQASLVHSTITPKDVTSSGFTYHPLSLLLARWCRCIELRHCHEPIHIIRALTTVKGFPDAPSPAWTKTMRTTTTPMPVKRKLRTANFCMRYIFTFELTLDYILFCQHSHSQAKETYSPIPICRHRHTR